MFFFVVHVLMSPVQNSKRRMYRYAIGCPWLLVAAPVEEKYVDFVDSRGLFSCRIPGDFLRAERAKDKKGTVFVAGNYNKAEVLSVQSLTTYDLLNDAGKDQLYYDLSPRGNVHPKNVLVCRRCSSFTVSSFSTAMPNGEHDRPCGTSKSRIPMHLYASIKYCIAGDTAAVSMYVGLPTSRQHTARGT